MTFTTLIRPSGWITTSTAELLSRRVLEIGDGYRARNAEFVPNGGLPFVRVADVGTRISLDGLDELPISQLHRYEPKVSKPYDSLITMKGTVGRVAYVTASDCPFVYSPQISYWRSNVPSELDPHWLRYWLEAPQFLTQAAAVKGSTDMADYINLRDQRRMTVTIPPLSTQRKIAAVLSSYDDLIENNNRRIKLLEEMAQRIYKEWFVDFRYPGHEDVTLAESDLGPIPQGWEASALFDVADVTFGYPFKSDLFNEVDGLPLIRIRDIPDGESATLTTENPEPRYVVTDGDILIGMDGDFHMGRWSAGRAWLNQRVTRVRPALPEVSRYALFLGLQKPISDWNQAIVGTTVAHLGKRHLEMVKILVPPTSLGAKVTEILDPLFDLEISLRKENRLLRSARDLLLPRLVSGEVDVTDLDIALPEAAA